MKVYKQGTWRDWITRITDFQSYLALLCCVLVVVISLVIHYALIVHGNFLTLACDTAVFQSALVNTLHGHPFRDSAYDGPNVLGFHSFFSLLWILPIYALAPNANTLFTLQIIGVYSTLIPLYLIGCHFLNNPKYAFLLTASILPNGLLYAMSTGPFHLETWISAATLWSYYGYLKNNKILVVLSMLFAFGCGEQSTLIYIALGLLIMWRPCANCQRSYGRLFLASAMAWMIFALFVLPPMFRDPSQQNIFALNYENWNIQSPLQLPIKVLSSPWTALKMIFDTERWYYVIGLVGFPVLLSLFYMRAWPLILPTPIFFFMSGDQFFIDVHCYYFQFLFLAVVALLEFAQRFDLLSRFGILILTATCLSNLICASEYFGITVYGYLSSDPFNGDLHAIFDSLPVNEAVFCPHRYSAYLSNHPDMVMGDLHDKDIDFDKMVEGRYNSTHVHAAAIQYIFADYITDQCGLRKEAPEENHSQIRKDNIAKLLKNGEWEQIWSQNDVVLLHRIKAPPE